MPLGTAVGLGKGDFVLDAYAVPRKKGCTAPPNFWPMSVVAKRLDRSMPFSREVGLGASDIVLDGDPATPAQKGAQRPNFWPMSILTKRLDGPGCHLSRR